MEREQDNKGSLTSPLIDNIQGGGIDGEIIRKIHEKRINDERKKKVVVEEVKKQLWLAGPLICVSLLQFCLQLISVMFVGHLGELALSGASMATSFASVTGFSMLLGMASALDTLCGQSYGAKQYHMLALYVKFSSSCAKSWTGFSKEAFHNILTFLKLAIPSAVMVCLENWSFEMMVLLSGLLPNPQLETSVLSISLNTASTVWMIPFGLSNAVSTRVSNELGAGNPQGARLAVCVVLVMAVTEGILVGAVLILIRNIWGNAYSNEVQVVRYVAAMMPILAISNFMDGLQSVLSGSVRGCGWQKIGAFVNLGSYYLVGIPCAVLFAFVLHIGGMGLWLGIICALFVQVLSLLTLTLRNNWEQEAKKATERVHDTTIPVEAVLS
ncbi:hypothetical protein Vadar_008755 [Vaccinium darrowii]|uniref:Uncharacterized protein n=1 Tax=Vaccinium darrowii TaxID=229202 RepID=A0ACB7YU88_9ERIC|nr:hypothetical protein Vadar_008755 [Vaccinium darrowii]